MLFRLSTTGGEKGSADTVRDVRGFSVKFFTEDGNHDIVGNHVVRFHSLMSSFSFANPMQAGVFRARSDPIPFPQQKSQKAPRHEPTGLDYGE